MHDTLSIIKEAYEHLQYRTNKRESLYILQFDFSGIIYKQKYND